MTTQPNEERGLVPQQIMTPVRQFAESHERQPDSIASVIARAACDPSCDVAKLEALLNMSERLDSKDAEREFNRDFALAMMEMPKVAKRGRKDMKEKGVIPYETYEDLDAAIRPIETKYGFARSFATRISDKGAGVILVLTLTHRAGHSTTSERYCPPDPGPGRNDTQAIGSGESYGRRYLTKSRWNIITVGEDDDGNKAESLSEKQIENLTNMLAELQTTGEEMNRFLKIWGVAKVEDILPANYEPAMVILRGKLRTKQGVAR